MRSIPCGHQSLDFTCPTCQAAIADPAGVGRDWGVFLDEPTQASETRKRKRSLKVCAEIIDEAPLETFFLHGHKVESYGGGESKSCFRHGIEISPETCEGCPDFVQNLLPDLPDPISTARHPEPRHTSLEGWSHHPDTIQEHLEALAKVIGQQMQRPADRVGRGIITVGGGRYWPGIVIGIKALRSTGSTLPVEIWHGPDEEIHEGDLEGLGPVTTHEINPEASDIRTVHGWTNKLYALTHTQFKEVLFLDGDAYCVQNPAPLFDQLKKASFVFWEDMGFHETDVKWDKVFPAGPQGAPIIQGGQILIDTVEAWPLLRVVHWICQHSDYYFAHMYGDQDAWRLGLAAMSWAVDWKSLGRAPWSENAFLCGIPGQDPITVHRCQFKFFVRSTPMEAQVLRWLIDFQDRGF